MSRALITPAPRAANSSWVDRLALAKPQQAALLLTATAGAICAILFLWLLVTPLIRVAAPLEPIWSLALPLPDAVAAPVAFRESDARRFSGARIAGGAVAEPSRARLEREIGVFLDRHPRRPVILYLSSTCDASGDSGSATPALLTTGDAVGGAAGRVPLDELIGLLKARGKEASKLLVLDVGQVGPDRDLGLGSPDLVATLKDLIGKDSSIAVLLACAPGQMSWVDEARGTSVFAHVLAEALGGGAGRNGRVTAGELRDYIRPRVGRWVAEHRAGAVQTPELIGNPGLRLSLPHRAPEPPPRPRASESEAKALQDLLVEWKERRRLSEQSPAPSRVAPIAWRAYQVDLLSAERLWRSGSPEAAARLDEAARARASIERAIAEGATLRPISLALARVPGARGVRVPPDEYEKAVLRLLEKLGDPQGLNPDRKTPAIPRPTEPAILPAKPPAADEKTGKPPVAEEKKAAPPAEAEPPSTPGADGVPAEPVDPLAILVDGDPATAEPIYVEAQVPVWYARFVAGGGETPGLRETRVDLVRRAFEVRKLAESAARDERTAPWAKALIDEADPFRRRGQDLLFGKTRAELDAASTALKEAENRYARALQAAEVHARAFELLDRLRDSLSFHGEWLARGLQGLDDDYLRLLDRAGELAERAYAPTEPPGTPRETLAELVESTKALERAFERDVTRSVARLARSNDWREVDALLHLPTLDPEMRKALLERVGSDGLSPAPDGSSAPSDPDAPAAPDPAFGNRAAGLARVEAGLLRLAGLDATAVESPARQAASNWTKNPDAARAALASVAQASRAARGRMVEDLDDPTRAADADRLAASLPPEALRRLTSGGLGERQALRRRELVAWQATRLCDDFAPEAVRELLRPFLTEAGPDGTGVIRKAMDLAEGRMAARLTVGDYDPVRQEVVVQPLGDLPRGLAAAFVPPGEGGKAADVTVRASRDPETPDLLAVEGPKAIPLTFAKPGRPAGLQRPVVFYRGNLFRRAEDQEKAADLVSVRVEQKILETEVDWVALKVKGSSKVQYTKQKVFVPDQFRRDSNNVYLYQSGYLDYRLILQNLTDRPLNLFVSHGLERPGRPLPGQALVLEPGKVSRDVVGRISAGELAPGAPTDFVVKVHEGDSDGREVAPEVRLKCYEIEPRKKDISVVFDGFVAVSPTKGLLQLTVDHSESDRVTSPMQFRLVLEPAGVVNQQDRNSMIVPMGQSRTYTYLIDLSAEQISYRLDVAGTTFRFDPFVLNNPPKAPPRPPAATPPAGAPEAKSP